MARASAAVSIRPVGLEGELTISALVRGVMLARMRSSVMVKLSAGSRLIGTGVPPFKRIMGG